MKTLLVIFTWRKQKLIQKKRTLRFVYYIYDIVSDPHVKLTELHDIKPWWIKWSNDSTDVELE